MIENTNPWMTIKVIRRSHFGCAWSDPFVGTGRTFRARLELLGRWYEVPEMVEASRLPFSRNDGLMTVIDREDAEVVA